MNLDDALITFVAESRDLLQQMEQALLEIEDSPGDTDLINAIFRAAHTIKGSAGLFGLDDIVAFTHVAESVLDRVRAGELAIDFALSALLLMVCDHISDLVDLLDLEGAGGMLAADVRASGAALVTGLQAYLDGPPAAPLAAPAVLQQAAVASDGGAVAESDNWHISLRFGPDVLRNGMDPLAFIRYLGTLGRIDHVVTVTDAVPGYDGFDPETCYLGFEVSFHGDTDKATIESVFEFVREDSQVRILPPHSMISAYVELINALPEQEMRLGEMLVKCGTLSPTELAQALASQEGGAAPACPIGEVLVARQVVSPQVVEAALEKQKQNKDGKGGESNLIRVDAEKLDQLINQIGELIIAGAGVNLIARSARQAELLEAASTLSRLVEQVRDSALTLRMAEIGTTFKRFQRVVHDVSHKLGKQIELVIQGGETELDKTVVEKIGDPLTHLVRNAIDHGIESPEVRLARGKPACGTLCLNAFHDSGCIVIEVQDDGGGLSRERILRKAVERGLVAEGEHLSDQEVFNLVFEPGFSTAEEVSNLSGRGVGMDVVRRNITALRGTVDLDSVEGEGTTVRVRLPLTLAIIDGFQVNVGKSSFVIPLDLVVECIELSPADRQAAADRNYIDLRGQVLPYVDLRDLFAVQGERARRENLVVVQYCGSRIGLVVDVLLGEIQTVIKPLGRVFSQVNGIGGSAILGSGSVALILDVPALVRRASSRHEKTMAEARQARNQQYLH